MTLVELVIVIAVVGILATAGAVLLGRVAGSSLAGSERLQLAASVDAGLRRVATELQGALPNSVRVTSSAGSVFIEYVPVLDAGRYRREAASDGSGDPLDLDRDDDAAFDVLGPPVAATGAELVVNNLGTDGADAYAGANRRAGVVLAGGGSLVQFSAGAPWPAGGSGQHRFHLVGTPVSVVCVPGSGGSGRLVRITGYGWSASQPASLGSGALASGEQALLLGGVSDCAASHTQMQVNLGVVTLSVAVQANGETARLLHQVAVDNTP